MSNGNSESTDVIISDEFRQRVKDFNRDFYSHVQEIAREKTPQLDGEGRKIIEKRPDGYDYIIDPYMRDSLDRHFPGWSWEPFGQGIHFLGAEWVGSMGTLVIYDPYLIPLGINPPVRKFFGVDYVRVQYKKDKPHTPEWIVDIGDNAKSANTAALKYAINRLTKIGDDVYGKRVEYEGSGSLIEIFDDNPNLANFMKMLKQRNILGSKAMEVLGIKSWEEIKDFKTAMDKIIEKVK